MPSSQLLLKKDLIKLFYGGMLMDFPPADVCEFWDRHPLVMGKHKYSGPELFHFLWDTNGFTPSSYNIEIFNSLESFYLQKGKIFKDCYHNNLLTLGGGPGFEPQATLWIFQPVIKYLIGGGDFYKGLFRASHFANSRLCPGSFLGPVLFRDLPDGRAEGVMVFANDAKFTTAHTPWDCELHGPQIFQTTPVRFGFPPCEDYKIYTDFQPAPGRIDASLNPRIENGVFSIGNEPYGTVTTLYDFIKKHSFQLKPLKPPDVSVVLVKKDYYCPVRKRVVLHKDAVYGSPVFIYSLIYRPKWVKPNDPNLLASLTDEIMFPATSKWTEAEQKHNALLKSLAAPINAQYDKSSEAVTINGKFITSGVQARILRRIITAYVRDSRTEFERREFVADETLISDRFNPGFALRLKRIAAALDKADCGIRLVKHARGRFRLDAASPVSFVET